MFNFVPFGAIKVAPQPQWTAACAFPDGTYSKDCQLTPKVQNYAGVMMYGWNWSTNRTHNAMYVGDLWTVAFNIVAVGPPYATVPIDACTTVTCRAGGSTSVNGVYTWANYRPPTNTSTVTASFPLAQVAVELTPPPTGPPVAPPPPPPVPPGIPILQAPAVPVVAPVGTLNTIGVANISLQATAAGFLGAGFTQVGLKNRPIAMKMAALSGKMKEGSKFDSAKTRDQGTGIGRFE
jgi:hypothetical protein